MADRHRLFVCIKKICENGGQPGSWQRAIRAATRRERRGSAVVAASGLAAFLLALVAIDENALHYRLQETGGQRQNPGLFVIDMQSDQVPGIQELLTN